MDPRAEGLLSSRTFRESRLNSCKGLEKLATNSGILKVINAIPKLAETSYPLPVKMMDKIYTAVWKLCPSDTEELCFVDVHNVSLRHHPNGHLDSRPDFVSLSKSLHKKLKRKKIPIAWHHITNAAELKQRPEKAKGAGQCADYLGLANQALPNRVGILGIALSAAGYTLHWSTPSGLESSDEFDWSDVMPLLEYAYTLYVPKDRHLYYDDTITLSGGLALDGPPKWDVVTNMTVYKFCTVKMVGNPWHRMSWIALTADVKPFIIKDQYCNNSLTFTEGELYETLHRAGFALGFPDCVEYLHVKSQNKIITVGSDEQSRTKTRIVLATSGDPLTTVDSLHSFCKVVYDVTEAHRCAVESGILHRDISLSNILINPKQARDYVQLPVQGQNRPRFIDEVLSGDANAPPHALIIDLDSACKLGRTEKPSDESLHERTGTPKYIARSVAKGRILDEDRLFSRMPTLSADLRQRYELAYRNAHDPLRKFNDAPGTSHGGVIDQELCDRYESSSSLSDLEAEFQHLPRHDAESIFWCIIVTLLRALPADVSGPDEDINGEKFKDFWEACFAHHEICEMNDSRLGIFQRQEWNKILHEKLSFVAPFISDLIKQVRPEYALLTPAPARLHLHEAIQRLILIYLEKWKDTDVKFNTQLSRYVKVKTYIYQADCAQPLQNGQEGTVIPDLEAQLNGVEEEIETLEMEVSTSTGAAGNKHKIPPKKPKDRAPSKKSSKRTVDEMESPDDNLSKRRRK